MSGRIMVRLGTVLVLACASGLGGYALADRHAQLLPVSTGPASRPASRPADEPFPSPSLAKLTQSLADQWRGRLGTDFNVIVDGPFVVAGDMPQEKLRQYSNQCVRRPAEAMWKSYFQNRCDEPIAVLLFANDDSYRSEAERLFGDKDVSHFGYYRPGERVLVMNIGTGTGTLVHELTHALVAFDWPDVPLWFNEGLASLHEQCQIGSEEIVGLANWRLPGLQKAIRQGQLRSLADLIGKDDFYGPQRGLNYAHARYVCLYLQKRGLLKEFYRTYHVYHGQGKSAAEALQAVCGESVETVGDKVEAFSLSLSWPE